MVIYLKFLILSLLSWIIYSKFYFFWLTFISKYYNFVKLYIIFYLSCLICCFWIFVTFILFENNLWGFSYLFSVYFFEWHVFCKLDIFSLIFINLTNLLMIICIWSSYESNNGIKYKKSVFRRLLISLQVVVIMCFCVNDLLSFYILFEITLIPMLLIIGGWGLRQRKIHAVYLFVLYTFIGSIFFLVAIILLLNQKHSVDIYFLSLFKNFIDVSVQDRLIWFFIFIAFCIKIPLFPFHLWLPEAHVEAPTIGSMLLAGILLKLGTYGLLRFLFPLYPNALQFFYPIISLFCVIAIIFISFTALCQTDLKKIIAYSSISHMSYVMLGMCSFSKLALLGSIYLMIAHGFASAGLFYIIGCLYSRYHTRVIFYYGGLVTTMPLFSLLFFLFILANVSFPGSSNFISECLILIGLIKDNYLVGLLALIFIILTAIYSFWFFNRIIMGQYNPIMHNVSDLNFKEIISLVFLIFLVFIYGLFPNLLFQYLEYYCYYIIEIRLFNNKLFI